MCRSAAQRLAAELRLTPVQGAARTCLPECERNGHEGHHSCRRTGSRLFPLTNVTNKHLVPAGREPNIYVDAHRNQRRDARVLLKRVPEPQRNGVVEIRGGKGKIVRRSSRGGRAR